jgi:hypothetical protein
MAKKKPRGQELDANAVEVVAAEGLQPGQEQVEALSMACRLRNAAASYHQLFSAELDSTGYARS